MDRKYPNALAYIKIEVVIRVKQKLWAVKIWAKMIWKQPSSFANLFAVLHVHEGYHIQTCQNAEASQTSHVTLSSLVS